MDEGKLLLFIKNKVASRAPRRGRRLTAERKRKAESPLQPLLSSKQRQEDADAVIPIMEGEDNESCSDLMLIYNTVRGYCSVINKLWAHQTSGGLHSANRP